MPICLFNGYSLSDRISLNELAFETWLIRYGKADRTIKRHKYNLKVLARFVSEWSQNNLDQFVVNLIKEGKSHATINSYIDTIRLYTKCMGLSPELLNFKHLKREHKTKDVLSDKEIEQIINLPKPPNAFNKAWLLDSLFIMCVSYTVARPCEIANLTRNDITENIITIRKNKNRKAKTYTVNPAIKRKTA